MKNTLAIYLLSGMLWAGQSCLGQTKFSMSDAVSYAIAHRPELRASDARVSAARRLEDQARLRPNPRFAFRKEDLRPQTSAFGANSQTYWEANQLLETSGKRTGRIGVAAERLAGSQLQAVLDRRQIALAVKQSFWRAKAGQTLAALYDQDSQYFGQIIAYHEARFREGQIAEVDLLRVRLQGQQIRSAAANAHLDSERALLALAQEMNAPPGDTWVLAEDLESLEEPLPLPTGADPVQLRVEGQIAKQTIAQAQAQVKLEQANGRPDLLITGGYKRDVLVDAPLAGVQLDIPLFNRNRGAVAAARAEEDAAAAAYSAARNRLLAELSLARREYELRRDQYTNVFRPLREQAIAISEISRAAYQAGGLDLVRLLDAERARVDAQLSYVRSLESYHLSVAALNYAEGMDQ